MFHQVGLATHLNAGPDAVGDGVAVNNPVAGESHEAGITTPEDGVTHKQGVRARPEIDAINTAFPDRVGNDIVAFAPVGDAAVGAFQDEVRLDEGFVSWAMTTKQEF